MTYDGCDFAGQVMEHHSAFNAVQRFFQALVAAVIAL